MVYPIGVARQHMFVGEIIKIRSLQNILLEKGKDL